VQRELAERRLHSYADELGQAEVDIVLYYRDTRLAEEIGAVIARQAGVA